MMELRIGQSRIIGDRYYFKFCIKKIGPDFSNHTVYHSNFYFCMIKGFIFRVLSPGRISYLLGSMMPDDTITVYFILSAFEHS